MGVLALVVWAWFEPRKAAAHGAPDREIAAITNEMDDGRADASRYLRRGELFRLRGEWEAARADFDRAEALEAPLSAVALCRAALLLDTGDATQARAVLDRLLDREPDRVAALRLRSRANGVLGRPRAAADDLGRMLDLLDRPEPDDYLVCAALLVRCGEEGVAEALSCLDRGMGRLGPLVSLGLAAVELEVRECQFEAALARLERLEGLARDVALEHRGEILAAAGRPDEARAAWAAALAEIESVPRRRITRAARARGERVREALAKVIAVDGPRPHEKDGAAADREVH